MAESPSDTAEFLTIGEVAEILKVSFSTLRRWDRIGHLAPVRLHPGSPRRYRRGDVDALLDTDASA
jgi:excisionase family DNA binding protein